MKEALKDDAPPDNKQEEKDATKKDETAGKKDDDAAAAAAAGGATAAPAKANVVHHPDYEKDVIYLYQFPRTPVLPSLSPYCLKVETWLRLNGIKYEVSVTSITFFSFSFLFFSSGGGVIRSPRFSLVRVRACMPACRSADPARENRFSLFRSSSAGLSGRCLFLSLFLTFFSLFLCRAMRPTLRDRSPFGVERYFREKYRNTKYI